MKKLLLLLFVTAFSAQAQSIHVKSPEKLPETKDYTRIFLGGTIDMGNSEDWQSLVSNALKDKKVQIFNPRRDDWNKDWKPVKEEPEFRKQVEWELNALENSDYIIMYFAKESLSPISLLELGLYARSGKLLVVCPEGFWRKGNVDIVSEKYNIKQFNDIPSLISFIRTKF